MAHKRERIRHAIAAQLRAAEGLDADKVLTTRVHPTDDAELPVVIVYSLQEESQLETLKRGLQREASIVVEIRAAIKNGAIDDALDDLCEIVESAMESDPYFGRLATNSFLAGTTIGIDGEGDLRQGVAMLQYRVRYRT